jgi:hypothetical protein
LYYWLQVGGVIVTDADSKRHTDSNRHIDSNRHRYGQHAGGGGGSEDTLTASMEAGGLMAPP